MTRAGVLFLALKTVVGFLGSINLAISTAFLLQKPLTFFQLSIIYSLLLGTSLVLEYPSGNLADRFGRKRIYAVGLLFTALQYALYAGGHTVPLLYAAGVMGGVGDALLSGSLEAWLAEEERRSNADPQLHYVFGLSRSLTSLVAIIGSLGVGLLLGQNLALVYWGGAALLLLAALAALFLAPDNRGGAGRTWDISIAALKTFLSSPPLIFLALVLAAAFAFYSVFILYWQPRAQDFGVMPSRLPLLHSAYLLAAALSGYLYARYAQQLGTGPFLFGAFAAITLSFALQAFGDHLLVLVIALFVYGLGYGSVVPLFFAWATEIVPSDLQASVLSLINAIASLMAVLTTAAVGKMIEVWGLAVAPWIGLSLGVVATILLGLTRMGPNRGSEFEGRPH